MKRLLLAALGVALIGIAAWQAIAQPAPAPQLGIFRVYDAVNTANCTFAATRNCGADVNQVGQLSVDTVGKRITYRATATGLVPVASATDVFYISGSATKTVKVNRIFVTGTAGTNVGVRAQIVKRSTANSDGTCAAVTRVPVDSANTAPTAVVTSCTANPTTGTLVGAVASQSVWLPTTAGVSGAPGDFRFGDTNGQPVVLRGTAEVLAVNLSGTSITSGLLEVFIEFTEE